MAKHWYENYDTKEKPRNFTFHVHEEEPMPLIIKQEKVVEFVIHNCNRLEKNQNKKCVTESAKLMPRNMEADVNSEPLTFATNMLTNTEEQQLKEIFLQAWV